jgi:hypothetical protein
MQTCICRLPASARSESLVGRAGPRSVGTQLGPVKEGSRPHCRQGFSKQGLQYALFGRTMQPRQSVPTGRETHCIANRCMSAYPRPPVRGLQGLGMATFRCAVGEMVDCRTATTLRHVGRPVLLLLLLAAAAGTAALLGRAAACCVSTCCCWLLTN